MLGDDTDKSWEALGRSDPYYGVLSSDRFRAAKLDAVVKQDFFASGADHIVELMRTIESKVGPIERIRALDFGCGVGRLVLPLRQQAGFSHVTGIDVSPSMLAEAAKNARQHELDGVEFVLSDDSLGRLAGNFDFIHSYIVLQHIPVLRGEKIIVQLIRRLAPGGVAALHVPFARPVNRTRAIAAFLRAKLKPIHRVANMLQRRPWNEPLMQMNRYNLNVLFELLLGQGVQSIAVELLEEGGQAGAYLLVRRPH